MAVHHGFTFTIKISFFWNMLAVLFLAGREAVRLDRWQPGIKLPTEPDDVDGEVVGTRWAVLVAGSSGYANYRHQVSLLLNFK